MQVRDRKLALELAKEVRDEIPAANDFPYLNSSLLHQAYSYAMNEDQ
jgi:hypothetical protein